MAEAVLLMDKNVKEQYKAAMIKLDNDVREIEEIHEEMDKQLLDIERRIARLRRSPRA